MRNYKSLGLGLIFIAPIVANSSPLSYFHNESVNASRQITQSDKAEGIKLQILSTEGKNTFIAEGVQDELFIRSNLTINNSHNTTLKFDDIKEYSSNILTAYQQNTKDTKIFKFNFPVDKFEANFDKIKEYQFLSNKCDLFQGDTKTQEDLDSLVASYHLLTYLDKNKNNLDTLNINYISPDRYNEIKQKYLNENLKNKMDYDCSEPDPSYQSQVIKTFVLQQLLDFERVESLISNRSLNMKYRNSSEINKISNNFHVTEMKMTPHNYSELIDSYINVKYCSWETKDSTEIEQILKDGSRTIVAFGETLFNKKWQDRKALNYVYTFQSILKRNLMNNSSDNKICNSSKDNLKNLNNLYRKPVV